MFSKISQGVTNRIIKNFPDVTQEKAEQIEYGLYMFLADITKASIILIIAVLLGVFKYAIVIIALFGMLRACLGGIHSKTHLGCIATYVTIVFGDIYISQVLEIKFINFIVFPIALVLAYLYAPADLPCKPIKSKKQRKKLRIEGHILLIIYFTLSLFLPIVWKNIVSLITVIVIFMITPVAYRITNNRRSDEQTNKKGGESNEQIISAG